MMGVAMLALARFSAALTARRIVFPALALAVVAQLVTIVAPNYAVLALARCASGLAFAAMFTLAAVEGSRSTAPERVFATAGIVSLTLGAGKILLLGYGKQWSPHDGVFLALIVYYLAVGVPLAILALTAPPPPVPVGITRAAVAEPAIGIVVAALAVMGLYSFATGGVFAFTQQVGEAAGMSSADLGEGIAVITLIGAIGGLAAERLGVRRGRLLPTTGTLLLSGLVCLAVMLATSPAGYWAAMTAWVIVYWFSYPYIFGLAAYLDDSGGLAARMAAVMILTAAAGTAISGLLTRSFGPSSFGWVALAICCVSAALAAALLTGRRRVNVAAKPTPRPLE